MRERERISRILRLVSKIWEENPELRLCQLIGNYFVDNDNYNKEDEELEKRLKEVYHEVK